MEEVSRNQRSHSSSLMQTASRELLTQITSHFLSSDRFPLLPSSPSAPPKAEKGLERTYLPCWLRAFTASLPFLEQIASENSVLQELAPADLWRWWWTPKRRTKCRQGYKTLEFQFLKILCLGSKTICGQIVAPGCPFF